MLPDYYQILGISRNASLLEIKAAFRNLAKKHHPDKHGGDPEQERIFKEINEAYSILSNTDTKLSYDIKLTWQEEHPRPAPSPQPTYRRPPPGYTPPRQPYHYAPRESSYGHVEYVYSKWTLMYGKIFVVGLILFVVLFPIMLEYHFSNYFYNKGMEAMAKGDYYQAEINFIDAMRDLGGSNAIAAIRAAELRIGLKSNHKALRYIKEGFGFAVKTSDRAHLYYLRGIAERNLNHMEKAEVALTQALKLNFNQDSVYTALAPIYAYELKEYEKAVTCYDSLITDHPAEPDNYLNRGFCLQKLENHEAAIADFNYFMTNKGVNGSVVFLKGVSQASIGQTDSACVNFKWAKRLGIKSAATYIDLYCPKEEEEIVYPAYPF